MSHSPDGRFYVRQITEKSFHSYFEAELRLRYEIVEAASGKVVHSFWYSEFGNSGGYDYSGVRDIAFSDDGRRVITTDVDGKTKEYPLPGSRASPVSAGITYDRPTELTERIQRLEGVAIVRLRNPKYLLEISIMVGPFDRVLRNASATSIRHEGGPKDGEMLGRLFLGTLRADAGGGEVTSETSGKTAAGYAFLEQSFRMETVVQCAVLLFHPAAETVALFAYRGNEKHAKKLADWKRRIVESLRFL